eukprot:TRINITY_DN64177_c0_g1_i1.p1 TRINITY_DN64177_c0_g1~~TRINITY_DN64177_c0_g1_i1.p1  ORF type:complete len:327 (+),score=28.48 TRINITY_DN64177_c0_g1_i1:68-1048(+)
MSSTSAVATSCALLCIAVSLSGCFSSSNSSENEPSTPSPPGVRGAAPAPAPNNGGVQAPPASTDAMCKDMGICPKYLPFKSATSSLPWTRLLQWRSECCVTCGSEGGCSKYRIGRSENDTLPLEVTDHKDYCCAPTCGSETTCTILKANLTSASLIPANVNPVAHCCAPEPGQPPQTVSEDSEKANLAQECSDRLSAVFSSCDAYAIVPNQGFTAHFKGVLKDLETLPDDDHKREMAKLFVETHPIRHMVDVCKPKFDDFEQQCDLSEGSLKADIIKLKGHDFINQFKLDLLRAHLSVTVAEPSALALFDKVQLIAHGKPIQEHVA